MHGQSTATAECVFIGGPHARQLTSTAAHSGGTTNDVINNTAPEPKQSSLGDYGGDFPEKDTGVGRMDVDGAMSSGQKVGKTAGKAVGAVGGAITGLGSGPQGSLIGAYGGMKAGGRVGGNIGKRAGAAVALTNNRIGPAIPDKLRPGGAVGDGLDQIKTAAHAAMGDHELDMSKEKKEDLDALGNATSKTVTDTIKGGMRLKQMGTTFRDNGGVDGMKTAGKGVVDAGKDSFQNVKSTLGDNVARAKEVVGDGSDVSDTHSKYE